MQLRMNGLPLATGCGRVAKCECGAEVQTAAARKQAVGAELGRGEVVY